MKLFFGNLHQFCGSENKFFVYDTHKAHFEVSEMSARKNFQENRFFFSSNRLYMMCLMSVHPYTDNKKCLVSIDNVLYDKNVCGDIIHILVKSYFWTKKSENRCFSKFAFRFRLADRKNIWKKRFFFKKKLFCFSPYRSWSKFEKNNKNNCQKRYNFLPNISQQNCEKCFSIFLQKKHF